MTTDSMLYSDGADESIDSPNRVDTSEARDRLKDRLFSALEAGENTLIDAPTSLGKTYLIATTRWRDYPEITGGEPIVHIHQTKEARDDAVRQSRNAADVECCVLRGRTDMCPVAAGDRDGELNPPNGHTPSEWFDWMCDVRNNTFQNAHKQLANSCDLPCGEHCDAVTQWWDVTDSGDEPAYDVLHITANFAHVDDLIEGANVIFDEHPEYKLTFSDLERIQFQRATTNLLKDRSDGEYAMLDLKRAVVRDNPELKQELREIYQDAVTDTWLFGREETHRLAPAIGRAILNSEEVCEGRYHGQDGRVEVVIAGQDGEIRHVQHTPDLSQVRCVIGLDAFPSETRWEINTVDDLERMEVLSPAERNWWRRNERGLKINQIGEATRAYTPGWKGAGRERGKAIIQKVREKHGEKYQSSISPDSIEQDAQLMMADTGIEEPKTMHYGEQKSRNDFSSESVGLLIGCIDPGDESILDLLALCDAIATPEMMTTKTGESRRKVGRGFVGPDANIAYELLASVRENNLAQAAGRYARNPDDPDSGATVYVWSDAIPKVLVDEYIDPNYVSTTKKQESFLQALKENPSGCSPKTISKETGSDKSNIIDWLEKMEKHRNATKSVGSGYQGATEWKWCGENLETLVEFED